MKKISREQWTGYNAYTKWKGDLEGAKKFYQSKNINLKEGFFRGWDLKTLHYETKKSI